MHISLRLVNNARQSGLRRVKVHASIPTKPNLPGVTKRSANSRFNYFFALSVSFGRNYSGMPITPATNVALAARIIKLLEQAVKPICSGGEQILTLGTLLETQIRNDLCPVDSLRLSAASRIR